MSQDAITIAIERILAKHGWPAFRSSREATFALMLHHRGVRPQEIAVQHPVGTRRLDFALPTYALAIEIDGPTHTQPARAAEDAERDGQLARAGWLILRVDAYDEHLMIRAADIAARLIRA